MARLIPTLALVALLSPAAGAAQAPAQKPPDFETLFAKAMDLHQAGDILGAIDLYKAALSLDATRPDAHSNLGAAYVRLGQFDDGVREYKRALEIDPTAPNVRMNLALAYYKSARPDMAIPELRRVVASDPAAKNAYLILADSYLQTGEDQSVVTLLQPRAQMFGDDLAYAYLLGMALLHTGESYDGQKYIDRVFRAGDSAEAHLLMGTALLGRGDYPAAKDELKRAIEINPQLPTVHSLYGRALLALGEPAAAEREFKAELNTNINDFEANLQLGHLRRNAQKFDEASTYLARAMTIRPNDVTARKLLANLKLQTGDNDGALALLEQIVKEAPDLIEAHVQLATVYNRLQRRDDAERERVIAERLTAAEQAKQPGAQARPAGATPSGGPGGGDGR